MLRLIMKKLSLYIFLVLMFCNVGVAELITFNNIKIGDKISKHFNSQQISKYYIHDAEKTPKGERVYGKDLKYSLISFLKEDRIFKEDYEFFQIYYENDTGKVVSISGIDAMSSKDACLEKRKNNVSLYQRKNRITSLFNKKETTHTFPDGLIDHSIAFHGKGKLFQFNCYIYPDGIISGGITIYESNYNTYVYKKYNE